LQKNVNFPTKTYLVCPSTSNNAIYNLPSVNVYVLFFMPLLHDSVSEGNMFSGCPSAAFICSFFLTDLVTMISHERL